MRQRVGVGCVLRRTPPLCLLSVYNILGVRTAGDLYLRSSTALSVHNFLRCYGITGPGQNPNNLTVKWSKAPAL